MAAEGLKNFKEVVQNKAYRINPNDRKIFEDGDVQSFFGLSEDDCIEFILYDSSENQLPQQGFGLVRYIPLTTTNINDYFLLTEGTMMTKNNLPSEFFIDVERLIKEAGYANGIFKTQISLLNKRLGSYKEKDKVWIGEISPSRTEVRLFPLENSPNIYDIKQRFGIFYNNGDFKSDTVYNVFKMIEATSPSIIVDTIKRTYGESFYNKLKAEYKIQNMDTFAANVHKKFLESAHYEYTNRVSDVRDLSYGKPRKTIPPLQLSEDGIMKTLSFLVTNAVNFYLLQKDEQLNSVATTAKEQSLDEVRDILQTKSIDTKIDTTLPATKIVYTEKAPVEETKLGFKKKLKKELPIDPGPIKGIIDPGTGPVTKIISPEPDIILPVEKENPVTGEIIKIDNPPKFVADEPITIETPIGGGGGGGGTRGTRDFITDYNNVNPLDNNYGKVIAGEPSMDYQK